MTSSRAVAPLAAALLAFLPDASASGVDRSYCISFEPGFATNSCGRDLDVTWCTSDSYSKCTDRWKATYVPAQGRSTVSFDRDDEDKVLLMHACDRNDSECLEARNAFAEKH